MRITKKTGALAFIAAAAAITAMAAPGAQAADGNGATTKRTPAASRTTLLTGAVAGEKANLGKVVSTPASRAALAAVQAKIKNYAATTDNAYTFGSWSDPKTGDVVISTNAPGDVVARITRSATSRTSGVAIRVSSNKATISDAWHRRDDVPSYYAGGGISFGGGICSSGYPVKTASGARYMVTAGHCFANGAAVRTESGLNAYGTVVGRALPSLGQPNVDMELMTGASYAARVFTGGITSTSSIPIVAAGSAFVGYNNYCHSGRTTGTNCGHTAQSITGQVCTSSGCKSPVIVFTGGTMIQPGDSGGTFYAADASGAWIRGHVIASGGGTGYAETYTKVAARYGVTAYTG